MIDARHNEFHIYFESFSRHLLASIQESCAIYRVNRSNRTLVLFIASRVQYTCIEEIEKKGMKGFYNTTHFHSFYLHLNRMIGNLQCKYWFFGIFWFLRANTFCTHVQLVTRLEYLNNYNIESYSWRWHDNNNNNFSSSSSSSKMCVCVCNKSSAEWNWTFSKWWQWQAIFAWYIGRILLLLLFLINYNYNLYEMYGRMDTSELSTELNRPGIILYLYPIRLIGIHKDYIHKVISNIWAE